MYVGDTTKLNVLEKTTDGKNQNTHKVTEVRTLRGPYVVRSEIQDGAVIITAQNEGETELLIDGAYLAVYVINHVFAKNGSSRDIKNLELFIGDTTELVIYDYYTDDYDDKGNKKYVNIDKLTSQPESSDVISYEINNDIIKIEAKQTGRVTLLGTKGAKIYITVYDKTYFLPTNFILGKGTSVDLVVGNKYEFKAWDPDAEKYEKVIDHYIYPEESDVISFTYNQDGTFSIEALKEGSVLVEPFTGKRYGRMNINVRNPKTFQDSRSFIADAFVNEQSKIDLQPDGSSTDDVQIITQLGQGIGIITSDNKLYVNRPGHYMVKYKNGDRFTVDVSLSENRKVKRNLRNAPDKKSFSQILRGVSNVVKASSSSNQTKTNVEVIGSCEYCSKNPCDCSETEGCWSCIATYEGDEWYNDPKNFGEIYKCRKKCQYCGKCLNERPAVRIGYPELDRNDVYFDHYHPEDSSQCPYVKIKKTTTRSPSTPSTSSTTTTSTTTPSTSTVTLEVELDSAMYELLKTTPDETRFKQLLPLYDRNAEHAWDTVTKKGYTLLDIACLYEYEWAVDILLDAGVTPNLGRLNTTQTSDAIKRKLGMTVVGTQPTGQSSKGSGSRRR